MSNSFFDFSEFPALETERLILRKPVLSDTADIYVFRSDPVVQRYNDEPMTDRSLARDFIGVHRAEYHGSAIYGLLRIEYQVY